MVTVSTINRCKNPPECCGEPYTVSRNGIRIYIVTVLHAWNIGSSLSDQGLALKIELDEFHFGLLSWIMVGSDYR